MIYVKLSSAYKNDLKKNCGIDEIDKFARSPICISLIKIGYCSSTKALKVREGFYKTENATIKTIKLFNDGDMVDEHCLHKLFKKYKYSRGREWFYYSRNIIKFFDRFSSVEEIRNLYYRADYFNSTNNKDEMIDKALMIATSEKLGKEYCELLHSSLNNVLSFEEVKLYTAPYPGLYEKFLEIYKLKDRKVDKKIESEIKKRHGTDRVLKYICEDLSNLDHDTFDSILLSLLNVDQVRLYTRVGSGMLKKSKYRNDNIKINVNNDLIESKIDLSSIIYSMFKVGSRYKNTVIKSMLNDLYKKHGIKKTAKASDLKEYFEMKPDKIAEKDENGNMVRINGQKIIKKK